MNTKTVESYLDTVDYSDYRDYVPSEFALEYINFLKLVNGAQGEENKTPVAHMMMLDQLAGKHQNIANLCSRGLAKALPLTARVFTDTGRVSIKDVSVGDSIVGEDGKLTVVTHKSEVFNKPMYRIHLQDGRTQDVSEDHINVVIHKRKVRYGKKNVVEYQRRNLTVKELLKYTIWQKRKVTEKNPSGGECNFWIPNCKPINYTHKDLPLDPYTLGILLGDGGIDKKTGYVRLHTHKNDLGHYIQRIPYKLGSVYTDLRNPNVKAVSIRSVGKIIKKLRLNVHGNGKFIPEEYLQGSIAQRTDLLQGLMDTEGTVYKGGQRAFTSNSMALCQGVMDLVRSLGGTASVSPMNNAYRVSIKINTHICSLPRKRNRERMQSVEKVGIRAITPVKEIPSQCIRVDNRDHTFIVDDYVVTHNTAIFAEYLFLYLGVYGRLPNFGEVNLALYVSDSIENGVKNLRKNIEHRYNNSEFLQRYIPEVRFTDIRLEFTNTSGKKFIVKSYGAKALSLDSVLYQDTGKTTIGACKVGDKVFAPCGKEVVITAKSEVFHKPMYEIELIDGRKIKVSEDHINSVQVNTNPNNKTCWEDKDLTTKELLKLPLFRKGNSLGNGKSLIAIKKTEPVQYSEKVLPVDPYTFGLLLGDGSIKKDGSNILHAYREDMDFYKNHIPYEFGSEYTDKRNTNVISLSLLKLSQAMKELQVQGHGDYKHIPTQYLHGSIAQRTELLKGLMDTDGTISKTGRMSFSSNSVYLTDGVAELVRSLGGEARIRPQKGKSYKVEIKTNDMIFKLPRKVERFTIRVRTTERTSIVAIRRIADEPSQCIAVDSEEHQFLTDGYTRTHNTGVRGAKELGQRPTLAILDDLISDEDARSATVISSVEDTVYKAVAYALHPKKQKTIWSGTPFNSRDPLYKAIESGAWAVNVFPVCQEFPCTREEFRSAWPDRFDYDYVNGQYQKGVQTGKIADFNQELMLRIMSDEDRLILDSDIQWYNSKSVKENKDLFNFYITTDFATSEAAASDFSVISVWAYNNNGDWFWVDGIAKRQQMDRNVDDLFTLVAEYSPDSVGIEISGQQYAFISWIQGEMMKRNIYFSLAKDKGSTKLGIRPVTDKFARFRLMEPMFKMGKMFFPQDRRDTPIIKEAINELSLISFDAFKSKHDDFIDTVAMLAVMPTWKPSSVPSTIKKDKNGMWDLDMEEDEASSYESYIV